MFFKRSSFYLGQIKVAYRKSASYHVLKCLKSLSGLWVGRGGGPTDYFVTLNLSSGWRISSAENVASLSLQDRATKWHYFQANPPHPPHPPHRTPVN
jgi:hypothetical protein